jgi:hypothetical protein
MRKLHTIFGILFAFAFLFTGQYMRRRYPPVADLDDAVRLLYRSTHIYLLGAALVNMAVGAYYVRRVGKKQRVLQMIGSLLIIISPAFLLVAFCIEPGLSGLARPFTRPGIYTLGAGTLLHLFSAIGEDPPSSA